MSPGSLVGYFADDQTFHSQCLPTASITDSPISVYPTDVACGYVAKACAACGKPMCSPEQWAQAQHWVEQYG